MNKYSIFCCGLLAAIASSLITAEATTDEHISTKEIIHLLANKSGARIGDCDTSLLKNDTEKALDDEKMANYLSAKENAMLAATGLSYCIDHNRLSDPATGAASVGQMLALSAIASNQAGYTLPQIYVYAKYAKILLESYPNSESSNLIADLKKSGLIDRSASVVTHVGVATQTISASDMVSKYHSNAFAFKHNYNGKTIRVSGLVSQVTSASDGGAVISFDGAPNIKLNDRGFNDYVYCDVPKKMVNSALSVNKSQKIVVEGVYNPDLAKKLDGGIVLEPLQLLSCRVVQ
ncbi:MAG: hypothetical protein AB7C98_04535 [Acidithiobacillus sp.]|jgi:hypothetical protein